MPSHVSGYDIGKIKSAAINPTDIGAGSYAILRDPYTYPMKVRFEEAYRADPVVRSAINRKVSFILGKKVKTVFDIVDSFPDPHEARSALNIAMSDQELLNAKRIIDRVNRRTMFQHKIKAAVVQAKIYGRSALLVEGPKRPDGKPGLPTNIKVLNSKLLGQVRIDEYSWALQQIQYNTSSRGLNDPYNFLNASDILYFTNLDYHVSPYTLLYGLSDIEPIAHISETNRILNEEDFKECNYSMWAGYGLLKVPTTRNIADVNSFLQQFQPGKWTAISQDITAEVHELQKDLQSLLLERTENEKLILRSLNVPSMILGFEDVQNFATAQEVMAAWKESVLEEERTWLNNIVELQWFDTLLMNILNIDDPEKLRIKIMLAFEDIALDDMKSKVLAALPLYEAGLLPADKVLEYLGFDDIADQARILQSKTDEAVQQITDLTDTSETSSGPAVPYAVQYPTGSPKSLLNIVQQDQGRRPGPLSTPQDVRKTQETALPPIDTTQQPQPAAPQDPQQLSKKQKPKQARKKDVN
jgi:hypothetical protein